MVKLIGLFMIVSSILAFIAGAYIENSFSGSPQYTGNIVVDVLAQPDVRMSTYDYLAGFIFSYSIASLIIGTVFLLRV